VSDNRHTVEHILAGEDHSAGLGARTALGGVLAIGVQPIRIILQFIATALLSRILAPADFGLIASAVILTNLVGIFSDLGLSTATVQIKTLDQRVSSSLFWLGLIFGLGLMPLLWFAAPWMGVVFKDPRVALLTYAISPTLAISALGAQHWAIIVRTMQWFTMHWVGLLSHAIGAFAGVVAALVFHAGYWSLVVSLYGASISATLGVWYYCRWRPSLVIDLTASRKALSVGMGLTGFSFVNYFHRQLDNFIVGAVAGVVQLGLYSRAYQLMMMPITIFNKALTSAMEPALSRVQDQPERWRAAYLEALVLVTLLGVGTASCMIAAGRPLIVLLYGEKWSGTATIFEWLSASAFAGVPVETVGWIYVSLGHSRRMFIWSLIFTPIVGAGFLIGVRYGAVGVAMSYAIVMNLALIPAFLFATRKTPVKTSSILVRVLPIILFGIASALIGRNIVDAHWPLFARLVLSTGAAGLSFVIPVGAMVLLLPCYAGVRARILQLSMSALSTIRTRINGVRGRRRASGAS
jgi:PST family polysaccharide transporter